MNIDAGKEPEREPAPKTSGDPEFDDVVRKIMQVPKEELAEAKRLADEAKRKEREKDRG